MKEVKWKRRVRTREADGEKERESSEDRGREGKEKAVKTMSARSRRQTRAGTVKEFNQLRFSPRTVRSRSPPRSAAGGWTQNKTIKKYIFTGELARTIFALSVPSRGSRSGSQNASLCVSTRGTRASLCLTFRCPVLCKLKIMKRRS